MFKMTDIKRLHEVHGYYPTVPRRMGKTTYCYDSLLRAAQTEEYKTIAYVTNNERSAKNSQKGFIQFLENEKVLFNVAGEYILLYNSKIKFVGSITTKSRFEAIIEDYYE